ncbi:hypothetical protein C4D60_Mb10t11740 [Musa balbisiana]|uniref:BTB domain-containing protein n=1 Tax=Musa balbisiana TaxID=52838 RepID=A0A4S8IWE4_MUSBA|nr:hypothetical protein C4D60_Mb10t11740 [Musa balbisiana]
MQVDSSENLVKVEMAPHAAAKSFELLLCFLYTKEAKANLHDQLFLGAVTGTSLNSIHPTGP